MTPVVLLWSLLVPPPAPALARLADPAYAVRAAETARLVGTAEAVRVGWAGPSHPSPEARMRAALVYRETLARWANRAVGPQGVRAVRVLTGPDWLPWPALALAAEPGGVEALEAAALALGLYRPAAELPAYKLAPAAFPDLPREQLAAGCAYAWWLRWHRPGP